MGQYTPAVIVHDLAPPKSEWPDWIRPLKNSGGQDHERLVICSTHPRELTTTSHVDQDVWRWARRMTLANIGVRKIVEVSGVGRGAVRRVIETRELTFEERCRLFCDVNPDDHDDHALVTDAMDLAGVPRRGLSLHLYQRSCDVFLGVPFNIASYALLTHMIAQVCGMQALDFIHTYGDVHIYNNHQEQGDLQLTREPKPLPRLWLNPAVKDIDAFTIDDIRVDGYEHHPRIKAEVSV